MSDDPPVHPALFSPRVLTRGRDQFRVVGSVDVPHSGDAELMVCTQGRKWVTKFPSPSYVLSEAVGWLLAGAIGDAASPPDVCIVKCPTRGLGWASEFVPRTTSWDAARVFDLSNSHALGRALAVDTVILNEDRHEKNILISPDREHPGQWRATAIDYAAASIGLPEACDPAAQLRIDRLAPGLLAEVVEAGAEEGAADLQGLTDAILWDIAEHALRATKVRSSTDELYDVLRVRCDLAPVFVLAMLGSMRAREQ